MTHASASEFQRRVLDPGLNINSGVYSVLDPALRMRLNIYGEYEYVGLDSSYSGPVDELLRVSAFGNVGPSETEVAMDLFGVEQGVNQQDPLIGNFVGLYAGYAMEGGFRASGSSGGITSWLLSELLTTERIDGVIHMVPSPHGPGLFEYRVSRDPAAVSAGAKSRYYPGHLADVLTEVATLGGRYALTAIPSFAFEVRLLQRERQEYRDLVPYIFGLICGHQKTANYAAQLAWRVGIEPGKLEHIDFRKKDPAAPANRYVTEMRGEINGRSVQKHGRQGELFGTDWGLGLFKSNFSDFTEDAFNETADIALGDAWLPRYVQDSGGTNIVITRNPEIDALLTAAREGGRLHLDDISPQEVIKSQSALVRHTFDELPARYRMIMDRGEYVPPLRRQQQRVQLSLLRGRVQHDRLQISRQSHVAWVKAVEADDLSVFDRELAPLVRRYRRWQRLTRISRLPRRVFAKVWRIAREQLRAQ